MNGLLHLLHKTRRASMPSAPTDNNVDLHSTFRRTSSEPVKRRPSVESWLCKALPTSSGGTSSGTETVSTTASIASRPHSLRRRKRDFMRDAFVRVFVKHRGARKAEKEGDDDVYYDASMPRSAYPRADNRLTPVLLAPAPWEDDRSGYASPSTVDEDESSYCNRPSYGFPPFLKAEDPADGSDQDEEAPSEPEFVVPPVQIPPSYRKQDRAGGTMVAGDVVIFTRLAFKRHLFLQSRRLTPIPEDCRFNAMRFATVCN